MAVAHTRDEPPAPPLARMTPDQADEVDDRSIEYDQERDAVTYVCATCGASLDPQEWHRVAARSEGTPTVYLFCGSTCREAWLDGGRSGR